MTLQTEKQSKTVKSVYHLDFHSLLLKFLLAKIWKHVAHGISTRKNIQGKFINTANRLSNWKVALHLMVVRICRRIFHSVYLFSCLSKTRMKNMMVVVKRMRLSFCQESCLVLPPPFHPIRKQIIYNEILKQKKCFFLGWPGFG